MAIDRVTVSFRNKPTLTVDGRQYNAGKLGKVKIPGLDGSSYKGIRLDEHTYLVATKKGVFSKGYKMELVSTRPGSLDKYRVKISGGRIKGAEQNSQAYKAKDAKRMSGSYRFDDAFFRRFRARGDVTTKIGKKLRKAGLGINTEDVHRLLKHGALSGELINYLKYSKDPVQIRQNRLNAELSALPLSALPQHAPMAPVYHPPGPPSAQSMESLQENMEPIMPYDDDGDEGKFEMENEELKQDIDPDGPKSTRGATPGDDFEDTPKFPDEPVSKDGSITTSGLIDDFDDDDEGDEKTEPPARPMNPISGSKTPGDGSGAAHGISQIQDKVDDMQELHRNLQSQIQSNQRKQKIRRMDLAKQRHGPDNAQSTSASDKTNLLRQRGNVNRQTGVNYLDKVGLGQLLGKARDPNVTDRLGDRKGFPPESPVDAQAITAAGANKAILDAFGNHQGQMSTWGNTEMEALAVAALKDYIALPPDPPTGKFN